MIGILFNACYGGFELSEQCCEEYKKRTGKELKTYNDEDNRRDPVIVELFKEKGSVWMSGDCSKLALYEVDERLMPYVKIDEYDGRERVFVDMNEAREELYSKFVDEVAPDRSNIVEKFDELLEKLRILREAKKLSIGGVRFVVTEKNDETATG